MAYTNRSGSIATADTSQQLMPMDQRRIGLLFQNQSTDDLWISFSGAAVKDQPSLRVSPGGYWEPQPGFAPTGALNVIGPTAGQKFTCWEY